MQFTLRGPWSGQGDAYRVHWEDGTATGDPVLLEIAGRIVNGELDNLPINPVTQVAPSWDDIVAAYSVLRSAFLYSCGAMVDPLLVYDGDDFPQPEALPEGAVS